MDVQYQLRMSGEGVMVKTGAIGHGMTPHPISSKHSVTQQNLMISSNIGSSAVSPPGTGDYWKMPSPQVQNEILKHEVQQSKVVPSHTNNQSRGQELKINGQLSAGN